MTRRKSIIRQLFYILFILSFFSCTNQPSNLKREYSQREFNCFYEQNFDSDRLLYRWTEDILFFLKGDTLPGDRRLILEIAKEINELDLPISVSEAQLEKEANLIILFSSEYATDSTKADGVSEGSVLFGSIVSSKITVPSERY